LAEHVIDLARRLYVDLDAQRSPRPRHFRRLFRKAYGCSPREFRHTAGLRGEPAPVANAAPFPEVSWPLERREPWEPPGWKPMGGNGE
jgi:hypothetical protein